MFFFALETCKHLETCVPAQLCYNKEKGREADETVFRKAFDDDGVRFDART